MFNAEIVKAVKRGKFINGLCLLLAHWIGEIYKTSEYKPLVYTSFNKISAILNRTELR